jgi:cation diffusion facilitator CzcD-associated flavoprotein CzcO
VPRERVVAYLEDYARTFELAPRFGETVKRAAPTTDGWRVETSAGVLDARNLVIATGYNAAPHRPRFAGEEHFAGTIVHSAEYRNAAPYQKKRVLVVGAGNTGAEIALDLREQGATSVDLCVRGPIHVIQRDLLGVPGQVISIACAWIPVAVRDVLFSWLVALTVGDLSRFGIRHPDEGIVAQVNRLGRIPIIDIGTIASIKGGHITVRPDIRVLDPSGVTFTDGASAAYDAIVLATGFRPRLDDFLERASDVLDERGCPRRHGRETELPGLYFVGFHNVATGLLREIGREAKRVAGAIAKASR